MTLTWIYQRKPIILIIGVFHSHPLFQVSHPPIHTYIHTYILTYIFTHVNLSLFFLFLCFSHLSWNEDPLQVLQLIGSGDSEFRSNLVYSSITNTSITHTCTCIFMYFIFMYLCVGFISPHPATPPSTTTPLTTHLGGCLLLRGLKSIFLVPLWSVQN